MHLDPSQAQLTYLWSRHGWSAAGGVCLPSKLAEQGNKGQDGIVWETQIDLKCGRTLSRHFFNFSASQWGPDVLTSLTR